MCAEYAKSYTYKYRREHHWCRYSALGASGKAVPEKGNCCDRGIQIGGCKGKGFRSEEDARKAVRALEEEERAESLESN